MNSTANRLRRWSRNVHRELSFFFSGMLLIYAVSGLVMNHRDTINPNYSVEQTASDVVGEPLPAAGSACTRDDVVASARTPLVSRPTTTPNTIFRNRTYAQSLPQRRFERSPYGYPERRGVRTRS